MENIKFIATGDNMLGECMLHGKYVNYLYIKSAGAKLCIGCLKDGLFNQDITKEAKEVYPGYFYKPINLDRTRFLKIASDTVKQLENTYCFDHSADIKHELRMELVKVLAERLFDK